MPPKAPASRKSTGAITTTTIKTRTTDRRKSAPAPAIAADDRDYDADMPPPSSQRSEGDSQERLKTAAKSAKDNLRATADRCATIRENVEQAEEEISAVNEQLVQTSAKKEAIFLKALQAHLNTLDDLPVSKPTTKQAPNSTSSSTNLHHTTKHLLTLCASLEARYLAATHSITTAQSLLQTHLDFGATWPEDQACLIATLKAGARVVDKRVQGSTDEEVERKVRLGGESEEERRAALVLRLGDTNGGDVGVHEVMKGARSGLKRMTRGLRETAGGEDVDVEMVL